MTIVTHGGPIVSMVNLKRLVVACCVAAPLALAACESQNKSQISYSNPTPVDEDFQKGANRPPTAETLYRMAKLLETQGKEDQAYAVYLNMLERYPNYVPGYCGKAAMEVRQRRVDTAMNTLDKALAISPDDPVVYNDMGMCWMLQNDYEMALDCFSKAAAQSPNDARYKANMAMATGMLGRYDESYALYEQIMRPARAHYNVSVVAEARNDMAKADEEFSKAHALDSTIERKPRKTN